MRFRRLVLVVGIAAFVLAAAFCARNQKEPAPVMAKTGVAPMSVTVLNYHKVDSMHISLSVLPSDFAWQMQYLADHNYHTISPDEFYDSMAGKGTLPENPILITFDDGYADNYKNAYPILKKHNFKAAIFVVTGFLGKKKNYLTWDECREMEQNGISIEAHTVDHKSMTDLTDEQIRRELVDSKKQAEEELGHPVEFMAYPAGACNLHIAQLVKEAGYKAAFTIRYGNADRESNIYAIERVPIFHTENTNRDFLERITYTPLFEHFGWEKS